MLTAPIDEGDPLASAVVSAGNLHLSREACERYLASADSIALLKRDDQVLVAPLTRESGGGLLLKIRNARGDRVVHAQEFFRANGFAEEFVARRVAMRWDDSVAAFVLSGINQAAVRCKLGLLSESTLGIRIEPP